MTIDLAGRSRQAGHDVPSWVPDWRNLIDISFVAHGNWSAGGAAYPPHLKFLSLPRPRPGLGAIPTYSYRTKDHRFKRISNEAMELTAILLDRIVYTSSRLERQPNLLRKSVEQIKQRVATDLEGVSQHMPIYFTGETGQQAYAATMTPILLMMTKLRPEIMSGTGSLPGKSGSTQAYRTQIRSTMMLWILPEL
ncbi:hypothetical protein LTR85_004760 [Meristemomyces frigidus]|nr:hypothetical protein LTR85_004760 [Meristemomyces frigidus]